MQQPTEIQDSLVLRVAERISAANPEVACTVDSPLAKAMAGKSADRLLREQPEVLAFLLASTAQLDPETRAVAVFLGDLIFETFRLAGRATRPMRTTDFVASLRGNRQMAVSVGQAHDRFAERYLRNTKTLRQPALIRYVTGVLLEPDVTCAHTIPHRDLGPLFIVLKSVIDVLDESFAAGVVSADEAATTTSPASRSAGLSGGPL